ncbi:MAG TPA: prepilin-type N-terminal cleavage/methylation domain-containing protein [Acidimicrobiia bacterium]|jgi:type II secretory pathway pseudopilin PulG|nr:prepilin-type N-terminal cleavage/methylation domain-containing protein [Acidimicrobiia bacterium]
MHAWVGVMLKDRRHRLRDVPDERGFTIVEVMFTSTILLIVLGMILTTLVSLTNNEKRSESLVNNEQNVRFELDQLARDIRAGNPLVPLPNASSAATYDNQIEMVLGPTGGTQTVVRWTYDTTVEQMVRQVMSDTSASATIVTQSFFLNRVRNVETGTPVFVYYGQQGEDLVAQSLANGSNANDVANCAIQVHIVLSSDSNPGPLPFTETQDVEIRNRLPGNVGCG